MTPEQSERIAAAVQAELSAFRQSMMKSPGKEREHLSYAILTAVLFIKYTLAAEFATPPNPDNGNGELKND